MKLKLVLALATVGCQLVGAGNDGASGEEASQLVTQACTTLREQAQASGAELQINNERDVLISLFTILDVQDSIKKVRNGVAMWKSFKTMTSSNMQEVEDFIKKSNEEIITFEKKILSVKQHLLELFDNDVNKLKEYLVRMEDPEVFKRAMASLIALDKNIHLMESCLSRYTTLDQLTILKMRLKGLKDEESLNYNAFIDMELKHMASSDGDYIKLLKKRRGELEEYMVLKNKMENAIKEFQTSNNVTYLLKKLQHLRIYTVLGDNVDIKEEIYRSKKEIEREKGKLYEKLTEVGALKELGKDVESTISVVRQQQHMRRKIELVSGYTQGADELDKFAHLFRERVQTNLHNDINKLVEEIEKLSIEVIREAITKKDMIIEEIRSHMLQEISTVERLLEHERHINVENTPDIETKMVDQMIQKVQDYKKSQTNATKNEGGSSVTSATLRPTIEVASLIAEVRRLMVTLLATKIENKERQLKQISCQVYAPYRRLRLFLGRSIQYSTHQ